MAFTLGPRAKSKCFRLEQFETIGSTNAVAMERGRAGDPGRLWIVAGAQTAGRGRRGRAWQTAPGNLAASLLMQVVPEARHCTATLGFAAGLALVEAMRACAPDLACQVALDGVDTDAARVRLKWPNDLLVDGAKVAGILLEAVTGAGGPDFVVIGIGVNVRVAPDDVPYPATSLVDCGAAITAERLFEALAEAWVEQEALWDGGNGFAAVRERWLKGAAGLGGPVAVRMDSEVFRGTFETIDEEGMLVVRAADGSARRIGAGEVHFGVAATAGR